MPHTLALHPGSISPVSRITVDVRRIAAGLLRLTYEVEGKLGDAIFPGSQPSARADNLWLHSCFEAFIAATHGYYEFNFAPSSHWAAYRFDCYRAGMCDARLADPAISWTADVPTAQLAATLHLPDDAAGPLGLSAVIEHRDGGKSYWALAHPAGAPDFHDPACFVATLPAAG